MKHQKSIFACAVAATMLAGAAFASLPVVSDVAIRQNGHRSVTVTYKLADAPGIVTLEILKDGEPIGGARVQHVSGDVNRLVQPTTGDEVRTITWQSKQDWPNQKSLVSSVSARVTAWATNVPPNYCVVDLESGAMRYYLDETYLPEGGLTNDLYRTSKLALRKIPAGGVETTLGGFDNEYAWQFTSTNTREARHKVRFTKDFYMGVFEVTQAQWMKLRTSNPSAFSYSEDAATRPVETVWYSGIRGSATSGIDYWTPANGVEPKSDSFCGKLRALTGAAFDLPTECQWEFAAHGGTEEMFYNGRTYFTCVDPGTGRADDTLVAAARTNLTLLARWSGNGGVVDGMPDLRNKDSDFSAYTAENGTARVGSYLPNGYGLYDMLGNVRETCREMGITGTSLRSWSATDITDPVSSWAYNSSVEIVDGSPGGYALTKGGAWFDDWDTCRPGAVSADFYGWEGKRWAGFRVIFEIQ